jgi:predicted dehydrogenase
MAEAWEIAPGDYLPVYPTRRDWGIGVIGAGFIVRDCHLVAYRDAGFRVVGITSRTRARADEVAASFAIPRVHESVEALLDDPAVDILDVAVPPEAQPAVIERILAHPRASKLRGILAQKPLAMGLEDAVAIVQGCRERGIALQVNQNMRYDPSVRAVKALLARRALGDPVLATIDLRAIPHWMPWAEGGRSLSTFIMSVHHLDTFRYWLGNPARVLASTRPDPRTKFEHTDGINLYILEYNNGARASAWDDVWAGPAKEGSASEIHVRFRLEGTEGVALGQIFWPRWPELVPSTIKIATTATSGQWYEPVLDATWFPGAFAGTMAGLLRAVEQGTEPEVSGDDNLHTIALCEAVLRGAREHRVTVPRVQTA